MEIRNALDMVNQVGDSSQGYRVTQLYPERHLDQALVAVDLWEVEPGSSTPLVADAEEHILFVVSGSGELRGSSERGATVVVRKDSVVYVGHHEVHSLRNTGNETLRVLVSTPLVVRSGRALGLPVGQETAEKEQASMAPVVPAVPGTTSSASTASTPPISRVREPEPVTEPERVPVVVDMPDVEEESPAPDITGLLKRASEVPATTKPERRKPPAEPELAPAEHGEETPQPEEAAEEQSNIMELQVVFDGGSRGNPGEGYGSFMVQSPNRKPITKRVELGDNYTNNQAEYDTLIECLSYIVERLETTNRSPQQVALDIKTDSDLVVNQLTGNFKVKDAGLRQRHTKALDLLERFGNWMINWHPREESVKLLGH